MSTGNIKLDILLNKILETCVPAAVLSYSPSLFSDAIVAFMKQYPSLSEKEAIELVMMILAARESARNVKTELIVTAPPSFNIKAKSTQNVVSQLITGATKNITMTGYSLSGYFDDLVDVIIQKSQTGVFVKFFVNNLNQQTNFDKIMRYRGKFLKVYDYYNEEDSMSALHAKVICVDKVKSFITSANLSYHGQEGNIEIGALIDSPDIAGQIEEIFKSLLFKHVFYETT